MDTTASDIEINHELHRLLVGTPLTHPDATEYEVCGCTLIYYDNMRVIHSLHKDYIDGNTMAELMSDYGIGVVPTGDTWTASVTRGSGNKSVVLTSYDSDNVRAVLLVLIAFLKF